MNPETLLKKLIAISSVSGNEEQIGNFLFSFLSSYFNVRKIYVAKNRLNIQATTGNPELYLASHMDTVPGKAIVREDKEKIYGRGSCDAKGCIASMICAAIALKKEGVTDFGLYFTVGEETDFCGAKKVPKEFAIVGEPTNLFPEIGQKGLLGFNVTAKGKNAHGATPEKGSCAITKISEAVRILQETTFPESSLGKTALNIGFIQGGTAINTVPDKATISCELRTVKDNYRYKRILKKKLKGYSIMYKTDYNPVMMSNKLQKTAEKTIGKKVKIARGFTELYFWKKGIIFGPGNPKKAHTDKEYIEKEQLEKAVMTYQLLVEEMKKIKGYISSSSESSAPK
ncbi:M20 family peptidase [Candidatus Woesearchaeota archaeon]|nr:MAG: M20 family peptidase [Candidatus Woesearchaeota archaeon]